jgi:hypothetical protein
MSCASHIAVTRKNIVGSFRRPGLVAQWDMEPLLAIIMPELANRIEEVLLHKRVEAEKEDEIASVEDLDHLEMDLKGESERIIKVNLTSRDLKHRESA